MSEMIYISKEIEFDAGHRVPCHNGKCRNPHGHRYRVEVLCKGTIIEDPTAPDNGMLVDFGDLKSIMMSKIHDVLDHKFIVWDQDSIMMHLLDPGCQEIEGRVVFPYVPTAENIARWCWYQLDPVILTRWHPDQMYLSRITVWETPTSKAEYFG